jgi:hypothetical protein
VAETTVCCNFSKLQGHLKDIRSHARSANRCTDIDDLKEIIDDMERAASYIEDYATEMHKGAVSMENRLRTYRSAIESLGFKRT